MREREQKALKTVKNCMWWSVGVSMIPIVCVDMAAVAGVQIKMLADISKIYGIPFEKNRGKAAIASFGAFVVPHAAAFGTVASLFKAVPVVGAVAGGPAAAVFSWAYTWALGNMFIQHFESGGTFLNFNPEQVKEHFKAEFERGQKMAAAVVTGENSQVPV